MACRRKVDEIEEEEKQLQEDRNKCTASFVR
jgi:hypothetical protein